MSLETDSSLPTLARLLINPKAPFIDRDLSWLQFNERVLSEARAETNPALERLKFLSITASNLDEFFMIRVASLARKVAAFEKKQEALQADRLTQTAKVIFRTVRNFANKQRAVLRAILPELERAGLTYHQSFDSDPGTPFGGRALFEKQILPLLLPAAPLTKNDLNRLSNLESALLLPGDRWIQFPKKFPSFVWGQDESSGRIHIYSVDDLLMGHLPSVLGLSSKPMILRLTRDADVTVDFSEEDSESIPTMLRSRLGERERGRPVRLQHVGSLGTATFERTLGELKLQQRQAIPSPGVLGLPALRSVIAELPPLPKGAFTLSFLPLISVTPRSFRKSPDLFKIVRKRDLLLHHPYDSFDSYENWIQTACRDPNVTKIEQTVYRMDTLSQVMKSLMAAAKEKTIRVAIELRARFDELNNLALAEKLRAAGVQVEFGPRELKLHAKIALVTRKEGNVEALYTHLSTGNYNATTARQYTDLAILTAHPGIGADARHFFDRVFEGKVPKTFRHFLAAPDKLHKKVTELIDAEIAAAKRGEVTKITAKVNALVDRAVIDRLYRASEAGVRVDLLVRGACSLIPGLKGRSQNIRVISIVDRFLEHSRIYLFQHSDVMYLSSADWMPRNFFSRLEIAFPVLDPKIFAFLQETLLSTYFKDNEKAWELTTRGTWKRVAHTDSAPKLRAQFYFEELARNEYRETALD